MRRGAELVLHRILRQGLGFHFSLRDKIRGNSVHAPDRFDNTLFLSVIFWT